MKKCYVNEYTGETFNSERECCSAEAEWKKKHKTKPVTKKEKNAELGKAFEELELKKKIKAAEKDLDVLYKERKSHEGAVKELCEKARKDVDAAYKEAQDKCESIVKSLREDIKKKTEDVDKRIDAKETEVSEMMSDYLDAFGCYEDVEIKTEDDEDFEDCRFCRSLDDFLNWLF